MPPTKKPAAQPSMVDQLAEDAIPDEYPAGSPELLPYLQIRPRSRRAAFKRKYAELAELQESAQLVQKAAKVDDADGDVADKLRLWADLDDIYQLMEELLEMAALDSAAYQKWLLEADDQALATVFQVYVKRSQPGEASSSAS